MRTFVAIELPTSLRPSIHVFQTDLHARLAAVGLADGLRWAGPDKLHLTLRFLGAVDPSDIEGLTRALQATAQSHGPIELALTAVGAFPGWDRPRVLWLGIRGELTALARLQAEIETTVVDLGYSAEERGFQPHVTLARLGRGLAPADRLEQAHLLKKWAEERCAPVAGHWVASHLTLYQSLLQQGGARYRALAQCALDTSGRSENESGIGE